MGLWAHGKTEGDNHGIIGPYSFKSQPGQNVTVNDDCYQTMIMNCFLSEIEARDFNKFWC